MRKVSTFLGIIIIVVVALVLFGGVFAWQYYEKTPNTENDNHPEVIGGDKDSHGCLIAAGYSWCEEKQKCLRTWEESCETNQTAGWKTFDSGDGFEFKYPIINSFVTFNEPGIVRSNSDINSDGCYLGHENDLIQPNPVSEIGKITINNINFCVSQTSDSAMGHSYPTYLYTTTYKNAPGNHFTIILPFSVTACDNLKGGSNYQLCVAFFSDPNNATDKIAQSIMSTFKFVN